MEVDAQGAAEIGNGGVGETREILHYIRQQDDIYADVLFNHKISIGDNAFEIPLYARSCSIPRVKSCEPESIGLQLVTWLVVDSRHRLHGSVWRLIA